MRIKEDVRKGAEHRNMLPPIAVYHRVLHKNGNLSAFACGTAQKRYPAD